MKTAVRVEDGREEGSNDATRVSDLSVRVRGEYREMPGLCLAYR
jgi:hypothetical protein